MESVSQLLKRLNLWEKEGTFYGEDELNEVFSKKELGQVLPLGLQAVFCMKQIVGKVEIWKRIILFFENPNTSQIEKKLHRWVWNDGQSFAVFIAGKTEIYNAFDISQNQTGYLNKLLNCKQEDFSFEKIVTGKTIEQLEKELNREQRVDYQLLEQISNARIKIIETIKDIKPHGEIEHIRGLANAIIGRLVFLRYLIDRNVAIHFKEYEQLTNDDLIKILSDKEKTYQLFEHINHKISEDLFPFKEVKNGVLVSEQELVNEKALGICQKLLKGHDLKTGQMAMSFDMYDFSIIPIEFISNIYETFIGKEKQDLNQAFYTPSFLVEQMLENTLRPMLNEGQFPKILDPACGSGVFLVMAVKMMLQEKYKRDKTIDLQKFIKEHIYGFDIDENAIDIALFSLYLALIDNLSSIKSISEYQLPQGLKGENFICGDFFKIESSEHLKFDLIIGNPPWRIKDGNKEAVKYWNSIFANNKKAQKKEAIKRLDIDTLFALKVQEFANSTTKISLVVHSANLYKSQGRFFRMYWLNNFIVHQIFELAPVRREVFSRRQTQSKDSIAPAVVLTYQKRESHINIDNSLVEHISLKPNIFFSRLRLFIIEKYDRQEILQSKLLEEDWIFKTLVYGNVLDYHLIKRLNRDYPKISTLTSKNPVKAKKAGLFLVKQGFKHKDGNNEKDTSKYIENNTYYIDTDNDKALQAHLITTDKFWKGNQKYPEQGSMVGYLPPEDTFIPPFVLMKEGLSKGFKGVSAFSHDKYIFTSSITAIKSYSNNNDEIEVLRVISGNFNSILFAYFILLSSSSVGIEREQTHDTEKLNFPFIKSSVIAQLVQQIEDIKQKLSALNLPTSQKLLLETKENTKLNQLEEAIYQTFGLDEQEIALVDYAQTVSIPLVQREKNKAKNPIRPLDIRQNRDKLFLEKYAQVFIDFFTPRFTKHFGVKIFFNRHYILMQFLVQDEPLSNPIEWVNNNDRYFINLYQMAFEQESTHFYTQKDIKGFDGSSFYIIKPNEYKVWHQALAYLDAHEFQQVFED